MKLLVNDRNETINLRIGCKDENRSWEYYLSILDIAL